MTNVDRLLSYLFEYGKGWGPTNGIEPMLLEDYLALSRKRFGGLLTHATKLGLIQYDTQATTAFNDPVALSGIRVLNVYLTEQGWDVACQMFEDKSGTSD